MATYKGIQGYSVQSLASDPPAAQSIGQLWYNSASNVWKISTEAAAAWSAGGSMVVGRNRLGACGTKAAGLAVGGFPPGGAPQVSNTEEYDGTSWAEVTNIPIICTSPGMAGTQTAALWISGGQGASPVNNSYTYNGASWTSAGARVDPASPPVGSVIRCQGCGTETAALTAGGEGEPWTGAYFNITESYNGTAWSEENAYPISTSEIQVMGTTALAIGVGGYPGAPGGKLVNDWNGTSWTAGTNCNTGRTEFGSSHVGAPSTNALIFGGNVPPHTNKTEEWNGTSWTEIGILATSRSQLASGGSATTAIAIGGSIGGTITGATEVYDAAPVSIKTVTTS